MSAPETYLRGADECVFRAPPGAGEPFKQPHSPNTKMPQTWASARFERQIEHVHALGPRVFAELLGDIARRTGQSSFIAGRVAAYAALDPEFVRFIGGDKFPPSVLGVVR